MSSTNPDSALLSSKFQILTLPQPYSNHNGGCLNFGLDGYLYCSFGDGGSGGDPQGNGQNRAVLLGKILRLNVDSAATPLNYSIPPSNPFYGNALGYRQEIFTYGMRNTWRFSLDSATGLMWAGDVGQNAYEEVDILYSGKNYGWNVMEGTHCYSPSIGCDTTNKRKPVWDYAQGTNGYAVTGGYVYRGTELPALYGKYIFGDYASGNIWKLNYDTVNPTSTNLLVASGKSISAFGVDQFNNFYVISYGEGKIYKLVIDPTGIDGNNAIGNLSIHQNAPNPFTHQTVFEYNVPKGDVVKLTIYNALGEVVKTLVNEFKTPGNYQVLFDAENLKPGM